MISTFHGLETARRALSAQQGALYTTGHNIANANTPGYSRQRVNLTPGEPFPTPGLNRPAIPGQLGTGVNVDSIQRYREEFLDLQYRGENSKHGYWSARSVALEKMEDMMNEPSEDGIATAMDRFWNALQDLSVHPEDSGARSVVRQRGYALAETFNYVSDSLKTIQRDLQKETEATEYNMNSVIRQINNINIQIAKIEPHGYVPNDLYDRRDALVDQLSEYVNIKVERIPSSGNASSVAEGLYTIKLADENGREMGVTLVDARRLETQEVKVQYEELPGGSKGLIEKMYFGPPGTLNSGANLDTAGGISSFTVDEFKAQGKLKAQMEAFGYYDNAGNEKGLYPDMIQQLDQMVVTFVEEFNAIHRAGWTLNDVNAGAKTSNLDFFEFLNTDIETLKADPTGAASKLMLSTAVQSELNNIAASASGTMKYDVMKPPTGYTDTNPSVRGIYTGADGKLEVTYNETDSTWDIKITNRVDENGDPLADIEEDPIDFADVTNGTIDYKGLKINVTGIAPTADTTWKIDVVNGYKPEGFSGDGSNALALANVKDAVLNYGGSTTNIQSFYQGVIGDMAVNTNEADRMMRNADTLRTSVDDKRMSLSSVSLDEEFTNMIKFQHAYNAAARNITMVDDMLDKIINGMGRAGL